MTAATQATELAQSSANAMLTAKARKVLSHVGRSALDRRETAVLSRAADLFARIVAGSLFIENRELAGIAASHVGLAEYERALSAARTLSLLSLDSDLTAMFNEYRTTLLDLSNGVHVADGRVKETEEFLSTLSEFFFSDLVRPRSDSTESRTLA